MRAVADISRGWMAMALLLAAAAFVGVLVARGSGPIVVAAVVFAGLLTLRMEYKLAIAFVLLFYPFSPGSIGPVPNLLLSEVLVPAVFPFMLMVVTRRGQRLLPLGTKRFGVALGVLVTVTAFHFVTGPVLGAVGANISFGSSGLRPFYAIIVYSLLFLMTVWVLDWLPRTKEAWSRFFWVLLLSSIALSVLRLTTVTLGVDTPLLTGVFDYGGRTVVAGGLYALRIGGLAETAGLGLACLAALWTMRSVKPGVAVGLLLWLLICVGLSGGRSLTLGVGVALMAYLLGPARGSRLRVLMGGAVVFVSVLALTYIYGYATQIVRILSLEGGLAQQDPARAEVFRILWGYFLANPLIGKGIGVAGEALSDAFVAQQVVSGGHSSYVSMLGNFGLVGAYFLLIFTFDPLVRSLLHTRRAPAELTHSLVQGLMAFVLIQTSIRALEYTVGGSGYQDPRMYLVTAVFVVASAYALGEPDDSS